MIRPIVLLLLTTPLTQFFHRGVVGRRIFRSINGWVPVPDSDGGWRSAMAKPNQELAAERRHPWKSWIARRLIGQFRFGITPLRGSGQQWFIDGPRAKTGRATVFLCLRAKSSPQLKWDDRVQAVAFHTFHSPRFRAAQNSQQWPSHQKSFALVCSSNGD